MAGQRVGAFFSTLEHRNRNKSTWNKKQPKNYLSKRNVYIIKYVTLTDNRQQCLSNNFIETHTQNHKYNSLTFTHTKRKFIAKICVSTHWYNRKNFLNFISFFLCVHFQCGFIFLFGLFRFVLSVRYWRVVCGGYGDFALRLFGHLTKDKTHRAYRIRKSQCVPWRFSPPQPIAFHSLFSSQNHNNLTWNASIWFEFIFLSIFGCNLFHATICIRNVHAVRMCRACFFNLWLFSRVRVWHIKRSNSMIASHVQRLLLGSKVDLLTFDIKYAWLKGLKWFDFESFVLKTVWPIIGPGINQHCKLVCSWTNCERLCWQFQMEH